MAAPRTLELILAIEALLVLLLMGLNGYFLTRRAVIHRLREILFINSREFRLALTVLIVGTFLFFVHQAVTALQLVGLLTESGTLTLALIFQFGFGTMLIAALGVVFLVFIKYVHRIPVSNDEVAALIEKDMRRAIVKDDHEIHARLDLSSVGDIYTGRKRLGPYISLTHYRALGAGFVSYMEDRLGYVGDAILYSVGRLTARKAIQDILSETQDKDAALARIFGEIRANGIAIPEVLDRTAERIDVALYENATAAGMTPVGRTVCHYQAGMLAGIFEVLSERSLVAQETKCWGTGSPYCEFRLEFQPPASGTATGTRTPG